MITRREFLRYVAAGTSVGLQGCSLPLTIVPPSSSKATTPAPGAITPNSRQPGVSISQKRSPGVPSITYLQGSTIKLEQLNGEEDKQLHQPTLSQTFTRFGIQGSDLGYSFEHQGLVFFLFGDTVGKLDKALDTIATTDAVDPEKGVRLDYLMAGKNYLTIQPPGISMGAFETPIGGISLGGRCTWWSGPTTM